MPCLLAIVAVAFPRLAIILLWLFSNFFSVFHHNVILPLLGFIFLPLTLIVYTYLLSTSGSHIAGIQWVYILIAVALDLGLVGGGAFRRD